MLGRPGKPRTSYELEELQEELRKELETGSKQKTRHGQTLKFRDFASSNRCEESMGVPINPIKSNIKRLSTWFHDAVCCGWCFLHLFRLVYASWTTRDGGIQISPYKDFAHLVGSRLVATVDLRFIKLRVEFSRQSPIASIRIQKIRFSFVWSCWNGLVFEYVEAFAGPNLTFQRANRLQQVVMGQHMSTCLTGRYVLLHQKNIQSGVAPRRSAAPELANLPKWQKTPGREISGCSGGF